MFTEYVQTRIWRIDSVTFCSALAVGLLAANVLIVNNYRDLEDDKSVGKKTTVVIFGRKAMSTVYLINGIVATSCLAMATSWSPSWTVAGWVSLIGYYLYLWKKIIILRGSALNNMLKFTSIALLAGSIYLVVVLSIWPQGTFKYYNPFL